MRRAALPDEEQMELALMVQRRDALRDLLEARYAKLFQNTDYRPTTEESAQLLIAIEDRLGELERRNRTAQTGLRSWTTE